MAASDIDQKILGQLSKMTAPSNPLLSSALFQVLGLSVILARKLFRARKLRRLDPTRDTKSVSLYHHIIWLSREGLALTEVYILPFCQDEEQLPHCRVMAAKLRASFYHVFCLFHNNPSISQLTPPKTSPTSGPLAHRADNGQTMARGQTSGNGLDSRSKKAGFRDTIPSMTSESSYLTNPYAVGVSAQTPPPSYPIPPVPSARKTPMRPPGLDTSSPATQRSPPSSADFLLPPLNFVPGAKSYFNAASTLAKRLLSGSDPLRLSVALEHSAFLWDCAKDADASRRSAREAIREVYAAPDAMDDADFEDAAALVQALGQIARRGGCSTGSTTPAAQQRDVQHSPTLGGQSSTLGSAGVTDTRGALKRSAAVRMRPTQESRDGPETLRTFGRDSTATGTEGRSATLSGPTNIYTGAKTKTPEEHKSGASVERSIGGKGKGKQRRRSPDASLSEKERKRRLVQRAEAEVSRRASVKSASTAAGSRQATPPGLVGQVGSKEDEDTATRYAIASHGTT